VDLVAAMPISWMPLVADYNRFARRAGPAFWGTYIGYFIANVWFYGLGALLLLSARTSDLVQAIGALAIGWIVLPIILVDETDNAFADIYSAAVSLQNIWPRARQALFAVLIGAICLILALTVPLAQYENFLLLIGTFFVPLFGVLAADYFVLRRSYTEADLYQPPAFRWEGVIAWALGVVTYQALTRLAPSVGATFPAFGVSFLAYLGIAGALRGIGRVRPERA
jgi:putative hydroxymethylpyrimidine transporter CytX